MRNTCEPGGRRLGHIGETLLAPTLIAFGTPEQQQRFLPGILAGTEYWARGHSEPNAGSDLRTSRHVPDSRATTGSTARRPGPPGPTDWVFVVARCEPGSQRHHGLVHVCWRQDGDDDPADQHMDSGDAEFNEVFFDGARTEASSAPGAPGEGWKMAMALLGFERGVSTLGQQAGFEREMACLIEVARRNGATRDPLLRQRIVQTAVTVPCPALQRVARARARRGGSGRRGRRARDLHRRSTCGRTGAGISAASPPTCWAQPPTWPTMTTARAHAAAGGPAVQPRRHDLRGCQRDPAHPIAERALGMPR